MFVTIVSGGYGLRNGARTKLISRGQTIELPEHDAKELIALGVAAYAPGKWVPSTDDAPVYGHLDYDQLMTMKLDKLKKLAGEMGLDTKGMKSKADFANAISGVEVEAGEDLGEEADKETDLTAEDLDEPEDGEEADKAEYDETMELPDLTAEDPV